MPARHRQAGAALHVAPEAPRVQVRGGERAEYRRGPDRVGLVADAPRAQVSGDRPRCPVGGARADPARGPGQPVLSGREPEAEVGPPVRLVEGDRGGDLALLRVRGGIDDPDPDRDGERDRADAVYRGRMQREHGAVAEPHRDIRHISRDRAVHDLNGPDDQAAAEGDRIRAVHGQRGPGLRARVPLERRPGGGEDLLAGPGRTGARLGRGELPAPAVDVARCDQAGRRVRAGGLDRYCVAAGRRHGAGRGRAVQQGRNGDGSDGYHRGGTGRHGHPPPDPDRAASPGRPVDRGRPRGDGLEGRLQLLVQVTLVVDPHWNPSSTSSVSCRNVARAREAWLLTVPAEQFRLAAVSCSVRSIQ